MSHRGRKNHYETLGVSKEATAEQVKAAYRDKAKVLHPDKGGDKEEFAEVALAYDVLKDPARRLLYDTTGQDKRPPIEVEVQNILLELFNKALAVEDKPMLKAVREAITQTIDKVPLHVKELDTQIKKLNEKRPKIRSKGSVNVVHLLIDQRLQGLKAKREKTKRQEEIGKACLKALDTYEEDWEAPVSKFSFDFSVDNYRKVHVPDISIEQLIRDMAGEAGNDSDRR